MDSITLYARTIEGKIKQWTITKLSSFNATIRYGLINGKQQTEEVTHKTIDKEIASRIAKKRKEGYKSLFDLSYQHQEGISVESFLQTALSDNNTDNNNNLKPMKCKPFKERVMQYPVIGQPKLNGLRCVLRWESTIQGEALFAKVVERAVLRSQEGLEYYMPHITNDLMKYQFEDNGVELIYDGELYIHGKKLNYIKASCPMINDRGTISKSTNSPLEVSFNIFDLAIPDFSQYARTIILSQSKFNTLSTIGIKYVDYIQIENDLQAIQYRDECIAKGYEGCVLREMDLKYTFGFRSKHIRKFKTHMDDDFLITAISEKDQDPGMPLFVLKNDLNDELFECNPTGSREEQQEVFNNPMNYIGKYATIRYRERSGVKNAPFHANVLLSQGFRNSPSSDK